MDITKKIEEKIVNEAFKELLKEEPNVIKDLVQTIKESFKDIKIKDAIKLRFEESVEKALTDQFEELDEVINEAISDNLDFYDDVREVIYKYIEPQIKEVVVNKLKTIKFK